MHSGTGRGNREMMHERWTGTMILALSHVACILYTMRSQRILGSEVIYSMIRLLGWLGGRWTGESQIGVEAASCYELYPEGWPSQPEGPWWPACLAPYCKVTNRGLEGFRDLHKVTKPARMCCRIPSSCLDCQRKWQLSRLGFLGVVTSLSTWKRQQKG